MKDDVDDSALVCPHGQLWDNHPKCRHDRHMRALHDLKPYLNERRDAVSRFNEWAATKGWRKKKTLQNGLKCEYKHSMDDARKEADRKLFD